MDDTPAALVAAAEQRLWHGMTLLSLLSWSRRLQSPMSLALRAQMQEILQEEINWEAAYAEVEHFLQSLRRISGHSVPDLPVENCPAWGKGRLLSWLESIDAFRQAVIDGSSGLQGVKAAERCHTLQLPLEVQEQAAEALREALLRQLGED